MAYGKQSGRLVQCARSKFHGHHPENEQCGDCEPIAADRPSCEICGELAHNAIKYKLYCNYCYASLGWA
jgi:hypothetical protein